MSASQQTVGGEVSLTRNERLDRLPFNKAHRKLLVASGIGWAFDAMDVGLVSFVVAAIAADPHFNLTPTEKSWVLSIGFRRNGDRRRAWRLRGRPRWPQDGLRDAGDFRSGQWRYGVVMVAGGSADRSTGHRPRPGRAELLPVASHIGLGISLRPNNAADGVAGILLGNRLDHRRLHRLFVIPTPAIGDGAGRSHRTLPLLYAIVTRIP